MQELPLQIDVVLNTFGCKVSIPEWNISIQSISNETDLQKLINILRTLADVLEHETL